MNPNFFLITPFLATLLFNDQILCPDVTLNVINWRLLLDLMRVAVGFVIRLDRCRVDHALFHVECHFINVFIGFINPPRFYRWFVRVIIPRLSFTLIHNPSNLLNKSLHLNERQKSGLELVNFRIDGSHLFHETGCIVFLYPWLEKSLSFSVRSANAIMTNIFQSFITNMIWHFLFIRPLTSWSIFILVSLFFNTFHRLLIIGTSLLLLGPATAFIFLLWWPLP